MKNYFVVRNGQQKGPLTVEQILNSTLLPDDLVWSEGMIDWIQAKDVEDFKCKFPPVSTTVPPPFKPLQTNATDLENLRLQAEIKKHEKEKNSNENIFQLIVLIVLIIAGYYAYREYNDAQIKKENPFYRMR